MKNKNLKNLEQFLRRRKIAPANKISKLLFAVFNNQTDENFSAYLSPTDFIKSAIIINENEYKPFIEILLKNEIIAIKVDSENKFIPAKNLAKYINTFLRSVNDKEKTEISSILYEIEILKNQIECLKNDILENSRQLKNPNELWKLRSSFALKKHKTII